MSFNVLAAVPLAVQLLKSPLTPRRGELPPLKGDFTPPVGGGGLDETPPFVTESVEAYLLVELLNEKGEVINPAYRKYFVTSQGDFEQIGNANEETIDFGDECTQTGFLRFSLVNEHDQQPAYFDAFEIVHKPNTEKLTVTSWTDYYPFGKVAKTACSGAGAYRYGYQGEFAEKDGETDWNSFELRQYDSEIGRFTTTDPMGEFWSSYVGMGNDPVNLTDPTGGCTGCMAAANGMTALLNQTGTFLPEVTVIGQRESSFSFANITLPTLTMPGISMPSWVGSTATKANVFLTLATTMTGDSDPQAQAWMRARAQTKPDAPSVPIAVPATRVKDRDDDDDDVFYHYTNHQGMLGIQASHNILPNGQGKVYITDRQMTAAETFYKLFIGNTRYEDRGGYVIAFRLTNYQKAQLSYNRDEPYEYIYPGTLRIAPNNFIYSGINPFK